MPKRRLAISLILFSLYLAVAWIVSSVLATGTLFYLVGILLTACGATVLGVYVLISRLKASAVSTEAHKSEAAPNQRPLNQAPQGSDQQFAKSVQNLILEADQALLRSHKMADKLGKSPVHQLGLYLVCGVGATGKTTTLTSSSMGIRQLSGQIDAGGRLGGTAVGNFWFGEDVVLAEALGNVFSDEPKWGIWLRQLAGRQSHSSLGKLSKSSPGGENLRGVVLFCDVSDMLGVPDSLKQSSLAKLVQERLGAVGEAFQRDFPVYVVFSKSDRIVFFQEYFGRLIGAEDQQVFGCTLSRTAEQGIAPGLYGETQSKEVSEAFNSLYLSLADKRLLYLAREADPIRRSGIYEFPREVKRIRSSLVQFLVDAFQPNHLMPGPVLRGFYFTGIRQVVDSGLANGLAENDGPAGDIGGQATRLFKASDLQALAASPAPVYRSVPEKLVPRWAFVTRLFRDVILADRRVAAATNKRASWVSGFVPIVTLASICAVWVMLTSWSYLNNRDLLRRIESTNALPTERSSPLTRNILDRMEELRDRLLDLERFKDHVPWHLDFLLYSGELVHESAEASYFEGFRRYFLNQTAQNLKAVLAGLPNDPRAERPLPYGPAYEKLSAYLMITTGGCPSERPLLPDQLDRAWTSVGLRERDLDAAKVFDQFDFYSQHLAINHPDQLRLPGDTAAIENGRHYLAFHGPEERMYQQIVDEVGRKLHGGARLAEYAPEFQQTLEADPDQIPAVYTKAGWHEMQDAIQRSSAGSLGKPCVTTGAREDKTSETSSLSDSKLRETLASTYLNEYVNRWRQFLFGLHVSAYRDSADAAKKLSILDGSGSPLMLALYMLHENTQINQAGPSISSSQVQAATSSGLFNKLTDKLNGRTKTVMTKTLTERMTPKATSVSGIFEPVHTLFLPDATRGHWASDKNRKYLDSLGGLARAMSALSQASTSGTDVALNSDAAKSYVDGLEQVRQMDFDFDGNSDQLSNKPDDVKKTVKSLLEEPFRRSDGQFSRDPGKALEQKVNGDLKPFCASMEPLLNKFPFRKTGQDASIAEFASVFAPQTGSLAVLAQKASAFVTRSNGTWQQLSSATNLQVDPVFVIALNRLSAISDAFFENRRDAHLDYRLSTLPDSSFQSTKLTIDGRAVSNGETASWPGITGGLQIAVVSGSATIPCSVYGGTWAVFHLLADARLNGSDLTYPCYSQGPGGRAEPVEIADKQLVLHLHFEASGTAARQAFEPSMFVGLRCPARIVTVK